MMKNTTLRILLRSFFVLCLSGPLWGAAQATCVRNNFSVYPDWPVLDWGSAQLWFGRINLANIMFQPIGTILGSTVATAGTAAGISDETVMWTCDIADKDQLLEVFATNGDDRVGGFWDSGAKDGLPGYYQTWFPYVGIKITHVKSGKTFTRNWQSAPLTDYDLDSTGKKILIKAKHLSPVRAEIARVSTNDAQGFQSDWCGGQTRIPTNGAATVYSCTQPNAYIAFRGPGYTTGVSDVVGSDSSINFQFWPARNGVAFGMRQAASISQTATCVVRNATPEVYFGPITLQEFQHGETREANFSIQLECDRTVSSGNDVNQTALGIQVSAAAYAKAQQLNLVTPSGGTTYLLSDDYGVDASVATGVGISISDAETGAAMNFLGWPATVGNEFQRRTIGTAEQFLFSYAFGSGAGWYPVYNGKTPSGSTSTFNYTRIMTAKLGLLPGKTATAGKVKATAYVIVKVQ